MFTKFALTRAFGMNSSCSEVGRFARELISELGPQLGACRTAIFYVCRWKADIAAVSICG